MKLTRLRLHGFKSFVESSDFHIEAGLTGVVGPNGCGKSNLVEALRWVMGETSHKSLRAADMDSVIFAGTGTRPARNHAEVAMTIDNANRKAPAAFNESDQLEISRRIERDQGSVYRINGKDVRARDVQIMFADAATGARSPALVHQGRIGEIIQAKPEQRRRVLEDAAGVAGLHARRHEAELRLRAAETNLTRVEDVIGQLAGQIDGLKRQARQAIRYRELAAKVRKAEATLFHLRWRGAQQDVAEAAQAHDLTVRGLAARTQEQAESAREQAVRAAALPGLREDEARAAAALTRLTSARDQLDNEEARARERLAELERRISQFNADTEREQRLIHDADAALARLGSEEAELREEIKSRLELRSGVDARVAEAERVLSEAESRFQEMTRTLADLKAQRTQLENAVRNHRERLVRIDEEIAGVDAEAARLAQETSAFGDLDALAAGVEEAVREVNAREEATHESEEAHRLARQRLEDSRGPLAEADKRVQRLETEARTISKLLDGETKNLWPPVMDGISVEKGFEKALGAALGDDLDAPVEPTAPMRWSPLTTGDGEPSLPEGAQPLIHHVAAPPELARRLAQIGVVAKPDGQRLMSQLKTGQRLVSPEGDLWRWDGFIADAHAPTGAARRLAERARLADIETDIEQARADAAAREAWRTAQRALEAAREIHARTEREINRHASRQSALSEARMRLTANRDDAAGALETASQELARLADTGAHEETLATLQGEISGHRAGAAQVRAEAQAMAREAELADRRLQVIGNERAEWQSRKDGAAGQMSTIGARLAEAQTERTDLQAAPIAFAEKRRVLIGEIETAEAARRAAADRLAAAENEMAAADRAARASLDALSAAREASARAEERMESAKRRVEDIGREIHDILEVGPTELAALADIGPDTALPDAAEAEAELEKLRRDRERLGAVNLRAEEELREVETQHTSLTTERDDLVEAIKRLRQGIQSLNKEARERLLASFEVVNGHFQRLFTELFGGGVAELKLIESDDPLEAGLEIIARPPGKKPQTLSLLSGGEQALTALALIFAVFLTNPSPICVLDEVDAPLDDHNVERFCDLLHEMTRSTETRFVIITHNPITMARMNRLYGVTMAERGVSQLVSVDLEDAVRLREAS